MNTKTTDTTSDVTPPQQRILDYLKSNKGAAEATVLQARGLDIRAANNLVRKSVLTLTNGVYRLRQKVAEATEKPVKVAANTAAPAKQVADPAGEPAKEIEAPESVERPAKVEGEKPAKAAPAKKVAKVVEPKACLCGCGFMSKARFLPGHDAKLHSLVLRIHCKKAEKSELTTAEPTLEYLKTAPWMTDEIAASIHLPL